MVVFNTSWADIDTLKESQMLEMELFDVLSRRALLKQFRSDEH